MKRRSLIRRLFSLALTLALAVSLLTIPALANVSGDWEYEVEDGKAIITGYTGSATEVNIPSKLDGYTVTKIGLNAFYYRSELTSVTIPSSVTSIGEWAFAYCTGLTGMTIPGNVKEIGEYAFFECSGLKDLTLTNGLTSIGYDAFFNCVSLTGMTIPGSVTEIGGEAFYHCTSLTSVTIGSGVQSIGNGAFYQCSSLTSITIPSGVTYIGDHAFADCGGLKSITVASGNPNYCSVNGVLFTADRKTLHSFPSGKSGAYTVPDGVTEIMNYAFYGCTGLTSLTIPASVTAIGYAIQNCSSLTSITVASGNPNYCSVDGVLFTADRKILLTCPSGKTGKYTVPSGVTSIGSSAFAYCSGLTGVKIPSSVMDIGDYAFADCDGLTSVTIPNGVKSIGRDVFSNCSALASVTFSSSVTYIGEYAFCWCSALKSVTIPSGVKSIEYGIFYGCDGLESVTIPSGVTSIGDYAFAYCDVLKSVTIPGSVRTIGDYTFSNCRSLTDVTIMPGVRSIGYCAFDNCTSLTRVTIPSSVTEIGGYAFFYCSSLKAAAIPEGIATVKNDVFYGCSALTDIVLPGSLKTIEDGAFYECGSLVRIRYPGTAADWAKISIAERNEPLSGAALSPVLSVSYASKTIKTGEIFTFTPKNNIGSCTWRTGNASIATVASDGTVTGKAVGNTYLYCADSTGAEAKCLLKITAGPLSIRYSEKTVNVGAAFQFEAKGGTGSYTWRVGNTALATVSSTGKVTGKAAGNTYLYCKDSAGTEVKCLLKIVYKPLSIRYGSKTVMAGSTFRFEATGGSGGYTWRVGNTATATVDSTGKVTGKAVGNTYLYCKDSAGAEVKCLLKIVAALSIRYSEKTVNVGSTFQFEATGGTGGYTWRTGNTATATVDSTGKVTGKAAGNTYLYCKDSAGNEVRCLLKIK